MSTIPESDLKKLNQNVLKRGYIDREDMLTFLTLIPTNDGQTILEEVEDWLNDLHANPLYGNVSFIMGDISAIVGDLSSYGRVKPETILHLQGSSIRNMVKS